jgi:hypothetical protein
MRRPITAGATPSACGRSRQAALGGHRDRIYGARHGVRGIVNEDLVDLTQETSHNLELVAGTPASALGSTRDKPDLAYCQEIFKVLQAHDRALLLHRRQRLVSDTVRIVSLEAQKAGYPLRCIHIPKTIDNDLVGNDHTPGFPVGRALRGAGLRRRQPGQRCPAGRVCRRRHGPPCGLSDRSLGAGQEVPRRRPAPDLPARAHLQP